MHNLSGLAHAFVSKASQIASGMPKNLTEAQDSVKQTFAHIVDIQTSVFLGTYARYCLKTPTKGDSVLSIGKLDESRRDSRELLKIIRRETDLLRKIHHPNILKMKSQLNASSSEIFFKVQPLAGTLAQHATKLGILDFVYGVRDITNALHFLHSGFNLAHTDVSPYSIFITQTFDWVLGGFGFCTNEQIPTQELALPRSCSDKNHRIAVTRCLSFCDICLAKYPPSIKNDLASLALTVFHTAQLSPLTAVDSVESIPDSEEPTDLTIPLNLANVVPIIGLIVRQLLSNSNSIDWATVSIPEVIIDLEPKVFTLQDTDVKFRTLSTLSNFLENDPTKMVSQEKFYGFLVPPLTEIFNSNFEGLFSKFFKVFFAFQPIKVECYQEILWPKIEKILRSTDINSEVASILVS